MSTPRPKAPRGEHGRETLQFATASGVQATVSTSVDPKLITKMRQKLEKKLARSGHLPSDPSVR